MILPSGPLPHNDLEAGVKFRYRQPDQPCILYVEGDGWAILEFSFHLC